MHFKRMIFIISILCLLAIPSLAVDANDLENICKNGGQIHLESRTYIIERSFSIPGNTELIGQSGTVFQFKDECGIPQNVPMISSTGSDGIIIRNIRFEGNQDHQTYALKYSNPNHPEQSGKKAYGNQVGTFIYLINCKNIIVTGCSFNDNLGDGLRLSGCSNIEFSYNTGEKGGHDTFFALRSGGIRVHHNKINTRVNSGIRWLGCSHVRIYNNYLYWNDKGDAGPPLQGQNDKGVMSDIEVCNNVIVNSCGPGMWLVGKTSGNEEIWIHHNLFLNCGDNRITWVGGILASGYGDMLVENNVFDGCYRGSVVFYAVNEAWATEADAKLSKNIFCNAKAGQLDSKGPYGVENTISKQSVSSSQNCYYNNKAGNIVGCKVSDSDIFEDPKGCITPSVWTWNGKEWACPDVRPSEMGYISEFKPLTEEEIEDADEAAEDLDSVFDIFTLKIYTQAGENDTIILPGGINETPTEATGTIEYLKVGDNYSTVVNVPLCGLSEVQYDVNGVKTTHTMMIGEKTNDGMMFTNTSVWECTIKQNGDSFKIPGKISPENIKVKCITPSCEFTPTFETVTIEYSPLQVHPAIYLLFCVLIIGLVSFWLIIRCSILS